MGIEGTYGDELTLRAFADIFNIEIEIVSSLGNDGPNHVCWIYNNAINALPVFKSHEQTAN